MDHRSTWLVSMKWATAGIAGIWVSVPAAIQALVVLMLIDYAMGLLRALQFHEVCSTEGLKGLRKKSATMLLVLMGHFLARTMHLPYDFAAMLAAAFAANEAISIIENAAEIGAPGPPALLE